MRISRAVRADLERILAIQKEAYLNEAALYGDHELPPLRETLEELVREFDTKMILKAEIDGTVVGSIRVALIEETGHIGRLSVDPRFQRRGIGGALLVGAESVFAAAKRHELFTGSRSETNLSLYAHHGYAKLRAEVLSSRVTLVYLQKNRLQRGGST